MALWLHLQDSEVRQPRTRLLLERVGAGEKTHSVGAIIFPNLIKAHISSKKNVILTLLHSFLGTQLSWRRPWLDCPF